MSLATSQIFKVRTDSLVRYYESLTCVLLESGQSGARLNEILSQCLRVECVQCRIQVSAEELQQLAVSDAPGGALHPKLQRLRLGYCARQGCESYFYEVHLESYPGVDWEVVVRNADSLLTVSKAVATEPGEQRKPRRVRMFVGLGLLLLTALAWLIHAHILFAPKRHKYEIDPASTAPLSRH